MSARKANRKLPPTPAPPSRWLAPGIGLGLLVLVLVVYAQTFRFEFVNFDDNLFVTANRHIQQGLTLENVRWALTAGLTKEAVDTDLWRPLSLMSHMLDVQLFGLNAGAHHAMSVGIHALTAILLFLVLRAMTGAIWRCAFVAAVFGIHPQHVESVAWVAERKDVLCALFFVLTLGAYGRYARQPFKLANYLLVVLSFLCGLLSKPMIVTLPCVLLLLDYWPLGRVGKVAWSSLILEKLPLFALAGVVAVVTAEGPAYTDEMMQALPLSARLGNALVAYVAYLEQMFWPTGLAVFYPHPGNTLPLSQVALAGLIIFGLTAWVIYQRKRPYLFAGWFWYLGMLVPVIGIIQSGNQARADRYTYLPEIGIYILIAWGAVEVCGNWRHRRAVLGATAAAVLASLLVLAHAQTAYWQDSTSLWTHTLACTSGNYIAHNDLGCVLNQQGKRAEAIQNFEQAVAIKPDYADAHVNWGTALTDDGKYDAAIEQCELALKLDPDSAEAESNWGYALILQGKYDEAIPHCEQAVKLNPGLTKAHYNLGNVLFLRNRWAEAVPQYEQVLELNPENAAVHNNLGMALENLGRSGEALSHFQKALDLATAQNDTALAETVRAQLKDYSPLSPPNQKP